MKTNDLTKFVISEFEKIGAEAERVDSVGMYDPARGAFRRKKGKKGNPDISAKLTNGRTVHAEIKVGSDKLRLSQYQRITELQSKGEACAIIKEPEDFEKWKKDFFRPLTANELNQHLVRKTRPAKKLPFGF